MLQVEFHEKHTLYKNMFSQVKPSFTSISYSPPEGLASQQHHNSSNGLSTQGQTISKPLQDAKQRISTATTESKQKTWVYEFIQEMFTVHFNGYDIHLWFQQLFRIIAWSFEISVSPQMEWPPSRQRMTANSDKVWGKNTYLFIASGKVNLLQSLWRSAQKFHTQN